MPGDGAIVTVPGSTSTLWQLWLAVTAGLLIAIAALTWAVRTSTRSDD